MRAIETELQESSQASPEQKKKRKRRKLLLLLLLLLALLGLTFTGVSRFFWTSPQETVSTDPRTPAKVEVIETEEDAETKSAITALQSMVKSLQVSVQELENHNHPVTTPDDDLPPQNITYDAYANLKDNNHINDPSSTSLLTRQEISNHYLVKATKLVDLSDVSDTGLATDNILKWDGTNWVPASDQDTRYTAENGLTLSGSAFRLGGTLKEDTTLNLDSYDLTVENGTFTVENGLVAGSVTATSLYQNGNQVCDTSGNCTASGTWILAGDSGTNQTVNDAETVTIAGGAGLSTVASASNTVTLGIGAGTGISVGADDVGVNQSYTFAWTGAQSWAAAADFNSDVSFADTDIAFEGASTNFSFTGNFSVNTDDLFVQKADGNVGIGSTTPGYALDVVGGISASDDLYISGIGLNDTGSNISSGASVIGVFDEFANSNSATVQAVLADLDVAISSLGGGHDPVTLTGAYDYLTLSGQAITLGQIDLATDVTGVLPLANGGTNKALTAANGGIIYSDADSLEVSAVGTAGQALLSSGAGAPTWGTLGLVYGGTNADLSGVSQGGIIYRGATGLAGSGSLTGVLKGNGSSAPTAMTGIQNYVTRWTDANTLGTGVLYDDATNVGIGTTVPGTKFDVVGGSIRADGDVTAGDLYLGYDDISATITTSDTDEALTLDPNGTGSIFLHGSTYYIDANGLIYASGLATTGYTPTAGELRADVFRDGNSAYYLQPADTAISAVFAGNVGIGTTSPDFALQVNGVIAPEVTDQDLGTTGLRWNVFANALDVDSTVTLSGLSAGTDDTILILNASNQVEVREIDPDVWSGNITTGSGTNGYVTYWTGADTLGSEQYLSVIRGGLGGDVTAVGAGELLYSTGANAYDSLPAGTAGYVLVSNGAAAPTWVDSGALGASYWAKIAGVLSPGLGEPLAATSAATTVATFTADGSNVALQVGGVSAYARFDNSGNLVFTNGSGASIDSSASLTIGGSTQTGLILGRSGISTRIANLTTDGVVFTSGTDGTLNSEAQLAITRGGTNSTASPTAGAVAYGTGTAYGFSSAGTIGQALLSGGTGSPTWGTLGLTYGGTNADLSAVATGGLIYKDATALAGTGALTGVLKGNGASAPTAMTGTTNYVTRWTDANTLGTGVLYDNGTYVGIGTTSPDFALQVNGVIAPETTDQDIGTTLLRWDIFANAINADSTVTLTGLAAGTDNTVLILNGSNQVETREIDPQVWSSDLITGAGTNGYVTYWTGTDTIGAEQYLSTIRGGLGGDVSAAGAGEILYSTGTTTYDSLAAGTLGYVLASGGTGAPTWVDPATLGTNYWQVVNGAFSPRTPYTNNADLLLGSDATESAKFAVLNMFPGSGTPTASVSSGLSGTSMFMTANGLLATQNMQSLSIGNATTGNILLHSGGIGNVGIGTTTPNDVLDVAGAIDTSTFFKLGDAKVLDVENTSTLMIGHSAGAAIAAGGNNNTLVGQSAAPSLSSGENNSVFGYQAGYGMTFGGDNTILGYQAGYSLGSGDNNIMVGSYAGYYESGEQNVYLGVAAGQGSSSGHSNYFNVAIGYQSLYSVEDGDDNNTAIGSFAGSNLTGANNTLLGYDTDVFNGASNSIVLGASAYALADNQLVIGSETGSSYINDVYIGEGITSSTPTGFTLNATGGSGTDTGGANLTIAGGKGTGNAAGGSILFATSNAGSSGASLQSLSTKMIILPSGSVGIGTTTPAQALHVVGNVRISGLTASLPVKTNANNDLVSGAINLASAEVTGILPLANGGTSADLSGVATGSIIYKGVSALEASGSLTGVLKGNGSSAPTAMTGTSNYVTRWTDANTLGIGVLYDNGTNVGISTTDPTSFKLQVAGNIGPNANNTYDLGSNAARWANIYATNFYQNGNQVCDMSGNCAALGNLWQYTNGAISPSSPYTNNSDLLVGSNATQSAKFAVLNIFQGSGTPTASVSSGLSGTSMFMTADGLLATQNMQSLSIGNASTGNILLHSGGIGNVGIGTTTPNDVLDVAGVIDTSSYYKLGDAKILDVENTGSLLIGHSAGASIQAGANYNSIIGYQAGFSLTTGDSNVFLGEYAGYYQTTAVQNVAIGSYAGYNQGSGQNVYIGANAGYGLTNNTGYNNVAIGQDALPDIDSGAFNVAIGSSAGNGIETGVRNTFIGAFADAASIDIRNSIGIGYNADVTASNQLVVGGNTVGDQVVDAYFGSGVVDNTPFDFTLNATGGSGTDIAGADFILAGGKGTGNAAGGSIVFSTSDAGISGTTLQTLSTKMIILADGNVGIGTTNPSSFKLQVAGSIGPQADDTYDLGSDALRWRTGYFYTSIDSPLLTYEGSLDITTTDPSDIRFNTNNTLQWSILSGGELEGNGASTIRTSSGDLTLSTSGGLGHILLLPTGIGNIGVGTTAPTARLQISGTSDATQFAIKANATQSNSNPLISLQDSSGNALLEIHSDNNSNTFVGLNAGNANTVTGIGTEGLSNTFIGSNAGDNNTTGSFNTATGNQALTSNTTGDSNTSYGAQSLVFNTSGSYNIALGGNTLLSNQTGSYNTAVGFQAGSGVFPSNISNNVLLGYQAGYNLNTGGNNNILLGYRAGDNITTGTTNIVLGYDIDAPSSTSTNTMTLGNLIYGTGLTSTGTTISSGSVGIGTSSPSQRLHVSGNMRLTGALYDVNNEAGSSGQILSSTSTGVDWIDPADVGTNHWDLASNVLHPIDALAEVADLVLGGTSTASADIRLSSNGTGYFGGNVGVGIATPAEKLAINSGFGLSGLGVYYDSANYGIRSILTHGGNSGGNNSEGGLQIVAQGTNQSTAGSGNIKFFTPTGDSAGANTDAALAVRMTILQGGNVGIGTTSPNDLLDVAGAIDTSTFYKLGNAKILAVENVGSLLLGHTAGASLTTGGDYNVLLGEGAGNQLTAGTVNTFVGMFAGYQSLGSYNTYLGFAAGEGANGNTNYFNVAIGYNTFQSLDDDDDNNVAVGSSAGANFNGGSNNLMLGSDSGMYDGVSNSIALGTNTFATANNQLVIGSGSSSSFINDVYIGNGVTASIPTGFTLNATGASGTDVAGANLTIAGGKGTGNAAGGSIVFSTSDAGISGTTLQTLSTKMIILADGNVGINDATPSYKLDVAGTGRFTGAFELDSTLIDVNNSAGTSGQVLTSTGTGVDWVDASTFSDADTLDGLDSLQFLRSDTSDNYTSGTLTWNSGTTLALASGSTLNANSGSTVDINGDLTIADTDIALDGASTNFSLTGNFSINTDDLFIDKSSGNVGIGTTNPSSFKLQVAGHVGPQADDTYDLGSDTLRWRDLYLGGETLHIGASTADEGLISYTAGNILSFDTDSTTNGDIAFFTDDLYLDKSTGSVGIGTTVPAHFLDVQGSIRATGYVQAERADPLYRLTETDAAVDQQIAEFRQQGAVLYGRFVNDAYSANESWLQVYRDTATYTVDKVTFPNGNIGIGTTGPTSKLQIDEGDIRLKTAGGGTQGIFWDEAGAVDTMNIVYDGSGTGPDNRIDIRRGSGLGTPATLVAIQGTTGYVGIGTTTPNALLHLQNAGAGVTEALHLSNNRGLGNAVAGDGSQITFSIDSPSTADALFADISFIADDVISTKDSSITFSTYNANTYAEAMRIKSGNVGIGTTIPTSRLQINIDNTTAYSDTANAGDGVIIRNINNSLTSGIHSRLLLQASSDNASRNAIGMINLIQPTNGSHDSNFAFQLRNAGGTYAEVMRMLANGNVGIGTTNPLSKLHVSGSQFRWTEGTADVGVLFTGAAGYAEIRAGLASDFSNYEHLILNAGTGGNVGIGGTSPSYKLEVTGDIYAEGGWLRVSGDNGLYFQTHGTGIHSPIADGGNYGSVSTYGSESSYEGYSIAGNYVFMGHTGASNVGIYNDINNRWIMLHNTGSTTTLYEPDSSTEALTINASGHVGFGTTSISNRIHLYDDNMRITTAASTGRGIIFDEGGGDTDFWLARIDTDGNSGTDNDFLQIGDGTTVGTSPLLTINTNGNLGIGDANPTTKLVVQGGASFTGTVSLLTSVLISSYNTSGTERLCWDGAGGSYIYDCSGSPGDYAEEYATTDTSLVPGDIVLPDQSRNAYEVMNEGYLGSKAWVLKSSQEYDSRVIGVVSTEPNEVIGQNHSPDENPVPIVLSGRIPVNISPNSKPIKPGDHITTSSTPGKGMKSTQAGMSIGRALESWTPGSGKTQILVSMHIAYQDPNIYLSATGDLELKHENNQYVVTQKKDNMALGNLITGSQAVVGKITAGLINTRELVVQQTATIADLSVNSLTISGQSLNDYIRSIVQLELQNSPNALPQDAIAQDFNSGMVIHNYNTTVTIVQDPNASGSATTTAYSATGSGEIANYFNITEVTEVRSDSRLDILANLISWTEEAANGLRSLIFNAPTQFRYLAWFRGPVKVTADTSGTLTIPASTLKARVSFSKPFPEVPTIYVNFIETIAFAHTISDVNESGFTINFINAPTKSIDLQWLALLRDQEETGPTLEIMESGAVIPQPIPTPETVQASQPENMATPTPTPGNDSTPSSTGLSDLLESPEATGSAPAPTAPQPEPSPTPQESATTSASLL